MSNQSLLDEIRERGLLRIAVAFSPPPEEGHPPEFFIERQSGEPSGVVCELGKIMARDLGVRVEWVDMPWPDSLTIGPFGGKKN